MQMPQLVDDGPVLEDAGLVHRVRQPVGAGPFPTLIMLHGWKGNEDVMWIFERFVPADWLIVAPRALHCDPAGGFTWHDHTLSAGWPRLGRFEPAVAAIEQFIAALPALYDADPTRMFGMGFSQGAATLFATAMLKTDLFRALAGLVGFAPIVEPARLAALPLLDVPVLMVVGLEDTSIPLDIARQCAATLRQAGATLDYLTFDSGHRLNGAAMREAKEWWQNQAATFT